MTEFLRDMLRDELDRAKRVSAESHKMAMNSYGAGYDAGYADALAIVSDWLAVAE